MVIDVWMQHPTRRFLSHDMFAALRRWTGDAIPEEQPGIEVTVAAMDAAGVAFGLLSAWSAPRQPPLISNPMIQHAHALDGLDDLGLDDETRELYLAGNARRVLGL